MNLQVDQLILILAGVVAVLVLAPTILDLFRRRPDPKPDRPTKAVPTEDVTVVPPDPVADLASDLRRQADYAKVQALRDQMIASERKAALRQIASDATRVANSED